MQKLRWRLLLAKLCCSIFVASAAACVAQQQIKVRLINGKSGKAVADQNFTAAWDRMGWAVIRTDAQGEGVISLPPDARTVTLISGPKKGKELYRIPYSSCSGNAMAFLDVDRVLASGFAPDNECSKKVHITPRPGEVIYYILPLPWYFIDMR